MKKQGWIQQGDVIITPITKIPEGYEQTKGLVLAEGEVTGHMHEVTVGDAVLYRNAEELILEVLSDEAVVTHQEHKPATLPRGKYKIGIVKEYDHFAEEAKRVAD